MKKIFKALAILVVALGMCLGIGIAAGCSGGNGTFEGEYHYTNQYGATYGMKVRVTVKNNIITKVEDITKGAYTLVSPGWEDYFEANKGWLLFTSKSDAMKGVTEDKDGNPIAADAQYYRALTENEDGEFVVDYTSFVKYDGKTRPQPNQTGVYSYGWTNANASNWTNNESWLLQKYEGWSVADILDIKVFIKETGEPYGIDKNSGLNDLVITGSTQGSGRLLLAIQDALGKKTEIGRIEKAE